MVKLTYDTPQKEIDNEPNWALSMAAAVPSGIIKIFEGTATLGADFDLKLKIIDYQNKKRSFVDVVGELGKGMSNPKAIAGAVQKFFGKTPYALNEKQSGANLAADKENLGKYFVLSDGTVKTVIQNVDGELIEDIVYSPSGITIEG